MPGLQEASAVASTSAVPIEATSTPPVKSPTIYVSYGDRSVKCRIDRGVQLDEILRQLVGSTQLGISEPAALFALRTESGELVTESNVARLLERAQPFVLTSSPTLEAAELVEKLQASEPAVLKLATFSLKTLIKEEDFLHEFERRGGLQALQDVVRRSSGNTLAYALSACQNLVTEERGWEGLEPGFAARLVEIIVKEPLINISRPATAILRRLSQCPLPASTRASVVDDDPIAVKSGFSVIYAETTKQPDFMKVLVSRLSSGDVPVATVTLALINSLFRGATEKGDLRLGDELERLEVSKVVGKLLESQRSTNGDISPLLAFQGNLIAYLHLCLETSVDDRSQSLLEEVINAAGLSDTSDELSSPWPTLGFQSVNPQNEFETSGLLGLKALASFARQHAAELMTMLKEQSVRSEDRRCPVATASSAVLLLVAELFNVAEGVNESASTPQPYLLRFYECHALAMLFFVRIWHEAGATVDDFDRVVTLTRSQLQYVFGAGASEKTWYQARQEFLQTEYRTVRDRQMRETEIEDELLNKAPVRNLRGRLYRESYEFVRAQRISCLMEGAWFRVASTSSSARKSNGASGQAWRFYRLAANRKCLHFVETSQRIPIRSGLDDLPERIDLSTITEIAGSSTNGRGHSRTYSRTSNGGGGSPSTNSHTPNSHRRTPSSSNPLGFSLFSADGLVAELVAPDQDTFSEWLDGLSMLNAADGGITTRETAECVQILTEVGVKIKLLDLSGERVEIPAQLPVGPVPTSTDFYYSDYTL